MDRGLAINFGELHDFERRYDFNDDYPELPTQPHRIEVTGEAEEHFRHWLALTSEYATWRHRHTNRTRSPNECTEEG
jgi:hypothetical protein